jgi:hypothetical protein
MRKGLHLAVVFPFELDALLHCIVVVVIDTQLDVIGEGKEILSHALKILENCTDTLLRVGCYHTVFLSAVLSSRCSIAITTSPSGRPVRNGSR